MSCPRIGLAHEPFTTQCAFHPNCCHHRLGGGGTTLTQGRGVEHGSHVPVRVCLTRVRAECFSPTVPLSLNAAPESLPLLLCVQAQGVPIASPQLCCSCPLPKAYLPSHPSHVLCPSGFEAFPGAPEGWAPRINTTEQSAGELASPDLLLSL